LNVRFLCIEPEDTIIQRTQISNADQADELMNANKNV